MALQEADYGMTDVAFQGNQGRFQGDEHLLVKFFTHPKLNQNRSAEEGRPIYEEMAYVQIMSPGNKDSIVMRPATDMDKQRFPEHFKRYEMRLDEDFVEGTLLEDWPGVTRSQCEELKFFNIRTVEQLVSVSDANAQNMMGFGMLKQKAEAYLEASQNEAAAEALIEANANIEMLQQQVAELLARVEAAEEE